MLLGVGFSIILIRVTSSCALQDGKIIGGSIADISKHPFVVSLNYDNSHICGGSIIDSTTILTAAHCLEKYKLNKLLIYAGSKYVTVPRQKAAVNWTKLHENYSNKTFENDIAIIKLRTKLIFGRRILPIALPKLNEETPPNSTASILGWGTTEQTFSSSAFKLRKVKVPVVDRNECKKKYHPMLISSTMICAGLEGGGKDACQGDSGGPMVVDGKLVGIVSWGEGCAQPKYPGVYTQVSKFRMWIKINANI